jgi:hypothetical protein
MTNNRLIVRNPKYAFIKIVIPYPKSIRKS